MRTFILTALLGTMLMFVQQTAFAEEDEPTHCFPELPSDQAPIPAPDDIVDVPMIPLGVGCAGSEVATEPEEDIEKGADRAAADEAQKATEEDAVEAAKEAADEAAAEAAEEAARAAAGRGAGG